MDTPPPSVPSLGLEKLPWYKWRFNIEDPLFLILLCLTLFALSRTRVDAAHATTWWFLGGALTAFALQRLWRARQIYRTPFTRTYLNQAAARKWSEQPPPPLSQKVS